MKDYPTIKKHFQIANDDFISFQGMDDTCISLLINMLWTHVIEKPSDNLSIPEIIIKIKKMIWINIE